MQAEFGLWMRLHDEIQVPVNIVGYEDRGSDFTRAVAGRAYFGGIDGYFGPYPLARDLHQAKL